MKIPHPFPTFLQEDSHRITTRLLINESLLLLGPFSVKPLEEAGFLCPKLNFALRNPIRIAEYAQRVVQEGPKNSLHRALSCHIDISKKASNMAEGQLYDIGIIHLTPKEALRAAAEKIPHGKYALFFIDNNELGIESILDAISHRPIPTIFTSQGEAGQLKDWLCEPQKRKNDVFMIGSQHQCNGIETELVIHVHVAKCPSCGTSNADPVIISRAKAMLVLSTYQRQDCTCGWNQNEVEVDWTTPDNSDEEREEDNQPLIEDNESQSPFWFRLLLLCKKRWKALLPVLLTLVIGTSILIGLFAVPPHIGKYYCSNY